MFNDNAVSEIIMDVEIPIVKGEGSKQILTFNTNPKKIPIGFSPNAIIVGKVHSPKGSWHICVYYCENKSKKNLSDDKAVEDEQEIYLKSIDLKKNTTMTIYADASWNGIIEDTTLRITVTADILMNKP